MRGRSEASVAKAANKGVGGWVRLNSRVWRKEKDD
jgi:hypothetical protein